MIGSCFGWGGAESLGVLPARWTRQVPWPTSYAGLAGSP
jgi:hypothetical protein